MIVVLEDVSFFARHGLFEHEALTGNEFRVNLSVSYPSPSIFSSVEQIDNIENSVSYTDLFQLVRHEMESPRKLLETVAFIIVKKILSRYPFVSEVSCKITKVAPPIPNFIGSASVIYNWKNGEEDKTELIKC